MGDWRHQSEKIKRLHRPNLKDWTRYGQYYSFPLFVKSLLSNPSNYIHRRTLTHKNNRYQKLPVHLDARYVSPTEFHIKYESHRIPVIISHIPQGYGYNFLSATKNDPEERTLHCHRLRPWPALNNWTLPSLEENKLLREKKFKCGEDDNGNSIKISLENFLCYTLQSHDDSPLYIFDDPLFDSRSLYQYFTNQYTVPPYFSEDYFQLVGEKRRPPYRWFLVGPERSGTTVHIDPLGTSAWNTVLYGLKLWAIFPPHVPKKIVKGKKFVQKNEDDEPIDYFLNILPRIQREALYERKSYTPHKYYDSFECYVFIQYPTETVFIPSGWWHAVLNLTHTVAVTQNFCSSYNFDRVWTKTRVGRKKLASIWLKKLETHHPKLAKRARGLNDNDGFIMKYPRKKNCRKGIIGIGEKNFKYNN